MIRHAFVTLNWCLLWIPFSCKEKDAAPELIVQKAEYITGSIRDSSGIRKAVYWINSLESELTDGTTDAEATGIDISQADVYVCGYEKSGGPDPEGGFYSVAVYWKNGVKTRLTEGTSNASAAAIRVVGDDVYVAGSEYSSDRLRSNARLWKNGVGVALHDGINWSYATDLLVDGNDVYVTGSETAGGIPLARLWKNGSISPLETTGGTSHANGIVKHGQDIYVYGSFTADGPAAFPSAAYWKNGEKFILAVPSGSQSSYISGFELTDGQIHASGSCHNGSEYEASYWHNGTFNTLPGGKSSEASGIRVVGSRVRVIGTVDRKTAVIWENGVLKSQTNGIGYNYILFK